jgi:hypothetical protein
MDDTVVYPYMVDFSAVEKDAMAGGSFQFQAGDSYIAAAVLKEEDTVVDAS